MSKSSDRLLCPGILCIIDLVSGDGCIVPEGQTPNGVGPECGARHSSVLTEVCLLSSGWGKREGGGLFHLLLIGPWYVLICFSGLSSYLLGLTVREMFNFHVSLVTQKINLQKQSSPHIHPFQKDHF